jgi:hypothetical protein
MAAGALCLAAQCSSNPALNAVSMRDERINLGKYLRELWILHHNSELLDAPKDMQPCL